MQLYRPVFPLKQQGQNCSGVKRLKYNGWKDFYSFRAASWELLVAPAKCLTDYGGKHTPRDEGSQTRIKTKKVSHQAKPPKPAPLRRAVPHRTPQRCLPGCLAPGSAPRSARDPSRCRNIHPPPRPGREKKKNRNNRFGFILRERLPTERMRALPGVGHLRETTPGKGV